MDLLEPLRRNLNRQTVRRLGPWLLISPFVAYPVCYALSHRGSLSFWDNAVGNWFAGTISIVVGIPIALSISRWQQREQDRRTQETAAAEERARSRKVLVVIRRELEYNRCHLQVVTGTT